MVYHDKQQKKKDHPAPHPPAGATTGGEYDYRREGDMSTKRPTIYELFKKYAVTDVTSVDEFMDRYYKPGRMTDEHGGPGCRERLIAGSEQEFAEDGFCWIATHDNVTGRIVAYYGPGTTPPAAPGAP